MSYLHKQTIHVKSLVFCINSISKGSTRLTLFKEHVVASYIRIV